MTKKLKSYTLIWFSNIAISGDIAHSTWSQQSKKNWWCRKQSRLQNIKTPPSMPALQFQTSTIYKTSLDNQLLYSPSIIFFALEPPQNICVRVRVSNPTRWPFAKLNLTNFLTPISSSFCTFCLRAQVRTDMIRTHQQGRSSTGSRFLNDLQKF